MLNGEYGKQISRHGLQVLNKPIDFPEPALGIGFAETLHFMSMALIQVNEKEKIVVPKLDELPIETASINAQGNVIDPNAFPRTHWLGD